jgi:hypothetical protein
VIDRLLEKNLVKDFFRALVGGASEEATRDLARRLGCDLDAPHLVLHASPWTPSSTNGRRRPADDPPVWTATAGALESALTARFPGILVDVLDRAVRALIPVPGADPIDVVAIVRSDARDVGTNLSIGLSNLCGEFHSFPDGFSEAESAAEIGALIKGQPGVTGYDELGPYRYIVGAEQHPRDGAQQRLERLVAYDRRRGTQLLDTLEAYLDHRGNVVGTSRVLYVHANTLRQRLDRVRQVTGIELDGEDWLSLAVATKAVKLRTLRETAGREGEVHG